MTCKQIHAYLESGPCGFASQKHPDEVLLHVANCRECNAFMEERKHIAECFGVLRNSAPVPSAALKQAVLGTYRAGVARRSRRRLWTWPLSRISFRAVSAWSIAVTFAAVVAYAAVLLFVPREGGWIKQSDGERRAADVLKQPATMPTTLAEAHKPEHRRAKPYERPAKRSLQASTSHDWGDSIPVDFQSLMYCDQISCPGEMDVIRVQLPSVFRGRAPSAQSHDVVFADVLVGPDGIARGIRVVE